MVKSLMWKRGSSAWLAGASIRAVPIGRITCEIFAAGQALGVPYRDVQSILARDVPIDSIEIAMKPPQVCTA
jgi:hypothetical protein